MSAPRTLEERRAKLAEYAGEPICPRCGNGYPVCVGGITHEEACAKYVWADDVCHDCAVAMGWEPAPTVPKSAYVDPAAEGGV